jgi:myo-inositol 2-dehydrogenase/D-chiro-inositol 1-dehydrogenase
MIHDFDMARWLLNEEPIEVFAAASVLVDPAIREAGDVDTAVVTLRTQSGALCQISNSRRALIVNRHRTGTPSDFRSNYLIRR